MSEDEKAALESRFPQAFTYEGHAFPAQAPGTLPVHRFWGPGGKLLDAFRIGHQRTH